VREKYCSGWKNKLKKTDYKPSEHALSEISAINENHMYCFSGLGSPCWWCVQDFFLLNYHMVTDYTRWYMRSLTELVDFSLQRFFFVTNIILFLNSRGKNWTLLQYLNCWTFKQKLYNNMYQATCPVLDFKNSSPSKYQCCSGRSTRAWWMCWSWGCRRWCSMLLPPPRMENTVFTAVAADWKTGSHSQLK
jgi:hypothetical protein